MKDINKFDVKEGDLVVCRVGNDVQSGTVAAVVESGASVAVLTSFSPGSYTAATRHIADGETLQIVCRADGKHPE